MKINTRTILIIVLLLIAGIFLFRGNNVNDKNMISKEIDSFTSISSVELDLMLDNKDFTLIDIHTPEQRHIPGTDYFIPFNDIDAIVSVLPNKDEKVVLYCRSGGMSKILANQLIGRGYSNIIELENGLNEWTEEGRETLPEGSITTQI